MAVKSVNSRFLPVAGILLMLLLAGALALVWNSREQAGPAAGNDGAAAVAAANQVYVSARRALAGEPGAFGALREARAALDASSTAGLGADRSRALTRVRAASGAVAGNEQALADLRRAITDLDALVPELAQRGAALREVLAGPDRALAAAQVERVNLLAEQLRAELRALAAGGGGDDPTQRLYDTDTALNETLRGLAEGDPALGLRPHQSPAEKAALDAIGITAAAISEKVRDGLAVSAEVAQARQAGAQLDAAMPELAARAPSPSARFPHDVLLGLLGGGLLLLLIMAWQFRRSADMRRAAELQAEQTERNQEAILRLLDELSSLADGDLTVQATVTEDITGAIADSINYAIEALRELVTTVNESAIKVEGAAKRTDATAQQLAEASSAQSRQIEAASQAIAQVAASVEHVSANAERSSDVVRHSVDVAHKGGDAVRRTIEGMNTIRETIQDTSKRIKRLGESSQEIGNIVELINDIADQTNILALNASIQASMAGEAGRGFAVVADEVQRLAERSANATRQIELLVRTIQTDTNEAVVSMERSTTDVVGGALLAENAGAALEEIEQVSNQIATLVQDITGAAREQASAAGTVTRNMDVLQEINAQTAAGTSATADRIRELAALASELRESVAGFRLPGEIATSELTQDNIAQVARIAQPGDDDEVRYAAGQQSA